MSIPYLDAVSFQKQLETGKTKPCLFICDNEETDSESSKTKSYSRNIDRSIVHSNRNVIIEVDSDFIEFATQLAEKEIIEINK